MEGHRRGQAPDFYVPGWFGGALMQRDLTAMPEAVVGEMEKKPVMQGGK